MASSVRTNQEILPESELPPSERYWAIYARVSTQEQSREGVSLSAQEEKCRLALSLEDAFVDTPVRLFREEGESGKDLERPKIRALIGEVEAGKVHGIICFSLDRLSRSILDFTGFWNTCELHDTRIISVQNKFDTSTPTGRLCMNMLMCFAQFERESIADRITTSVRHLRSNGHWTGGRTPIGYQLTRDGEGRCSLVPDPARVGHVRTIFEAVRDTRSLAAAARKLEHLGIARSNGIPFHVAALYPIIRNRTYLGEISCKSATTKSGRTITTRTWRPGKHEALIPRELFDAVASVAYRKSKTTVHRTKQERVFPLQGLLYCTACRATFTPTYTFHKGRKSPYTNYYRCQGPGKKTQARAHCPFHHLNAEKTEARIMTIVAGLADDRSGWLEEICQRLCQNGKVGNAHLQTERAAILKEKRNVEKEADNLTDYIKRAGTKAPKRLTAELGRHEQRLQALQLELQEKDQAIQMAQPVRADPDQLRQFFTRVSDVLAHATPEEQRTLLGLFIQRIDIARDGLVLHMYELPDEPVSPDTLRDLSSKTNQKWWARRDSNPVCRRLLL